ncbi:hypothetical protein HAX54_018247 [Datura stramonium]|uniref:Bulb-type lectin domain-containing protein n=1 Tax=Datura stramonium TaxID=4076 RepID=A0ABS8S117_DATST|nr:hypothetical protein [Datura stramonium]
MVKETVVSAGGTFELGFFSPNGSQGRYGLPVEKVAWVANRERPVNGSYGVLMINASDGNLGNLVLWDQNELNESVSLWESFNHPSNALLRHMKIGLNTRTSWKDDKNPQEVLQVLILNGSSKLHRSALHD